MESGRTVVAGGDFERRLGALAGICGELAQRIHTARTVLHNSSDDAAAANLVADALGAAGWLAERGASIAGSTAASITGGADEWLLPEAVRWVPNL